MSTVETGATRRSSSVPRSNSSVTESTVIDPLMKTGRKQSRGRRTV